MDVKGISTRSVGTGKRIRAAFTFVELLVVIATIAVLSLLLRPAHTASKVKTVKVRCQDNLRQIGRASLLYAAEYNGWFAGTIDDSSDDVSYLYPNYIFPANALGRGSLFVCPGTDNFIRTNLALSPTRRLVPRDLLVQANYRKARTIQSRTNDLAGVSYEVFGFMAMTVPKTEASVAQWVHQNNAFGLRGKVFGPSDIFLFVDGDRGGSLSPPAINNYPDKNDNHGAEGANMVMCDGSVKWVRGGAHYLLAWETSQDENRSLP